jgi:hypothetical protein
VAHSVPIVVTSHRVLFFGLRRGWLDLVDAPARHDVELVEQQTSTWRGRDDYVDVLVLKVRDQKMKFSFTGDWSARGALAVRALKDGELI